MKNILIDQLESQIIDLNTQQNQATSTDQSNITFPK